MALFFQPPAKVNLYLRVVGKRPDGYHELETVFHAIDLRDDLYAERTDEPGVVLELESDCGTGLAVAAGDDNLVVRAARAFLEAAGVEGGLRYRLRKRIPAGGGLGGGSSDAAAALSLADALCGEPLGPERLHTIAARLGADVPFFLRGGTQLGVGTGTELSSLADQDLRFLIVLPEFGTSTVEVYKNYGPHLHDGVESPSISDIEAQFSQGIRLASILRNDLHAAATSAYPALERLQRRITELGFPALTLSGSGSSMFLAFRAEEREAQAQAEAAVRSIATAESMSVILAASARRELPRDVPWPDNEPTG